MSIGIERGEDRALADEIQPVLAACAEVIRKYHLEKAGRRLVRIRVQALLDGGPGDPPGPGEFVTVDVTYTPHEEGGEQ